jgi:hypothetical protein
VKVHSIKRLTKAIFIAFGIALTGFVVTGASAAPTTYCGSATWDSSQNGYGLTQSVSYDAGIGRCKLLFAGDVNGAYFQEDSISNLRLPGFVSSINVAGVGAGGSTALDATNWWNDYFNNFVRQWFWRRRRCEFL